MPPHLFAPGGVHELVSMQLWAWFWLQMWLLTRLKPWGGQFAVYPFTRLPVYPINYPNCGCFLGVMQAFVSLRIRCDFLPFSKC